VTAATGAGHPAQFNQNIQMLRGIAVLLVLAFHLQVEWFAWGYLGVDLFFLVSGFLMPLILPKYSPGSFLMARVRRIYPALLAAIAVCFPLGWFTMMPLEMEGLSQSALAAIGSVSEFWFAANTGYFDQDQQSQPLLHTWSLGNEFLCYAIVALMLALAGDPKARERLALSIAIVAAIAFLAFWWVQGKGVNYFNPLPRIALFFIAFWVSARRFRLSLPMAAAITFAGGLVLALAFGGALIQRIFPSPAAFLLPLVGLPMMMLHTTVPLPAILRRPLGWLGDISYSLYIWHWPIIVFQMLAFRNYTLGLADGAALAALSLLAASISYYLIERNALLRRGPVLAALSAALAIVAVAGIATNGFASRLPPILGRYASQEAMLNEEIIACERDYAGVTFTMPCEVAGGDRETVVFIGDSHSLHFMPVFHAGEPEVRVMRLRRSARRVGSEMESVVRAVRAAGATRVYIAYRWYEEDAEGVASLISAMQQIDFPEAVLVRDIPAYSLGLVGCWVQQNAMLVSGLCSYDLRQPLPDSLIQNADAGEWLQVEASDLPIIDTHAALCDGGTCPVLHGDVLIYRDGNHLHGNLPRETRLWLYEKLFAADRQTGEASGP